MNERDVNGSTALILASGAGHAELVRILLVRGVDVLLADANSRTCLHVAAALGHQV
jgi:ankyrin repeat protein